MNKDTVTVIKSINYSEADKVLVVFGKNFVNIPFLQKV
jgi:hypothetical protein